MSGILAVVPGGPREGAVRATAAALAGVLGERVDELHLAGRGHPDADADRVLAALEAQAAVLGVLAAERPAHALCWQVVRRSETPVVLVPPDAPVPPAGIRRALVPLDGTAESALAVAETIRLLDRAGTQLVVLHVFDATTVPSFWDQSAHAYRAWLDEFVSRCGAPRNARVELRSGSPGEHVVAVAADEAVDLVALAWSRRLEPERARTVRAAVLEAAMPVLLVPIGARDRAVRL